VQPASINNAAAITPVLIVMLRYPHCYKHMDITGNYGFWQEKSRVRLRSPGLDYAARIIILPGA
jgi:hypothetical protein